MVLEPTTIDSILEFERFPFFIGPREPGDEIDLPSHLPFRLGVDSLAAIPRLILSAEIETALNKAYAHGSLLSTPLGEGPLASSRMKEMLDGLLSAFGSDVGGKRFLEIGCGYGHLLNELKIMGADVIGCEIGPQGEVAEQRFGIPIVREPLHSDLFDQPFDCIFSYGCLEHVIDLAGLLDNARSLMKEGGLFFHSVPNTDATFEGLRVDDLSHEHVSYFTADNGIRLLAAQGFEGASAKPTKPGNEIHLWGYLSEASPTWPGILPEVIKVETEKLKNFAVACSKNLANQIQAVETMLNRGESVGFYAGGHVLGTMVGAPDNIRYYNGDKAKHGKCLLFGFPAVRDPETLHRDPVDNLIVFAEHHYTAIQDYLIDEVRLQSCVNLLKASELR